MGGQLKADQRDALRQFVADALARGITRTQAEAGHYDFAGDRVALGFTVSLPTLRKYWRQAEEQAQTTATFGTLATLESEPYPTMCLSPADNGKLRLYVDTELDPQTAYQAMAALTQSLAHSQEVQDATFRLHQDAVEDIQRRVRALATPPADTAAGG